ncbi:catabolite repression protein creC [Lentinula aciculospora]|uniref:Catabolite repression protein creC n=1 Tax=Lentinula aciculospora TaxID=153920 RepID=A0A9W9A6K7_9AGAR|nr:catabolite repression protein creC [Lentinula aciculospora]
MESEATFVAPEGVYTVIEEHKPSVLQTHAAATSPISFPARVSVITVKYPVKDKDKSGGGQSLAQLLGGNNHSKKEKIREKEKEKEDGNSLSSNDTPPDEHPDEYTAPASPTAHHTHTSTTSPTIFSHHAQPISSVGKSKKPLTPVKWSKPKSNMKTTNSTFITRTQHAEGFPRSLKDRDGDVTFFFYNQVKSVLWVEAGAKAREPLSRTTFSAYPTCHSINQFTASPEHLDIVIGFHTGDLIWLDPISSRYHRLNKGGCVTSSPCTAIRWVPASASLFLVSHADGTIVVYDRDREDGTFVPHDPIGTGGIGGDEWDPADSIFVTMPPWHPAAHHGDADVSDKSDKLIKNPVSHWRIAPKGKAVMDFVFSPDVKYVGAISEDGCLRVIDALAEQLVDCYSSYFGAFTCIVWSPDGRFILTGGQDDLLTIFSPWEQRVVARCQGHSSFVSCIAFDETRCDGRTYRLGSVGEDNKLILWDFSSGALHRPKNHSHSHGHRQSLMGTYSSTSLAFRSRSSGGHTSSSALYLPPHISPSSPVPLSNPFDHTIVNQLQEEDELGIARSPRYHPAPSRNEIAVVQPVLVKNLHSNTPSSSTTTANTSTTGTSTHATAPTSSSSSSSTPIPHPLPTAIAFLPKHLLTSTKNGLVKLWVRPLALKPVGPTSRAVR